jgi:ATP phosphoribosyltransferase regulatory subunit
VADAEAVAAALDAKDAGTLAALGAEPYLALLDAAGPADAALAALADIGIAATLIDGLGRIVEGLSGVRVTLDPTERHGFEYQSWIGFSLFGEVDRRPIRTEIGRGGAYRVRHPDGHTEPACGFSLYTDPLVDAGLGMDRMQRIFLPYGTPADVGHRLRAEGHATVAALAPGDGPGNATHIWNGAAIAPGD